MERFCQCKSPSWTSVLLTDAFWKGQESQPIRCSYCGLTGDPVLFPKQESVLAPKKECDHIIGYDSFREYFYTQSTPSTSDQHWISQFKYCPECGEKLNTPNE